MSPRLAEIITNTALVVVVLSLLVVAAGRLW